MSTFYHHSYKGLGEDGKDNFGSNYNLPKCVSELYLKKAGINNRADLQLQTRVSTPQAELNSAIPRLYLPGQPRLLTQQRHHDQGFI